MIHGEKWKVLIGNNLDLLPTLEDNSVDSIVTDPPYELGFMGKKWDSTGIAYNSDLWRECLRVLKPGGHLLSFGGTRTWHRIAVAIEDAGFEVRDSIAWLSNKTFPKSLDISKAIDKGTGENRQRKLKFVNWMKSTGITASQANKILQEAGAISPNGTMAGHFFSHSQAAIATAEIFDCLKPYLPEVPEEIERLVAERTGIEWTAYKNRKKVGQSVGAQAQSTGRFGAWGNDDGTGKSKFDITESHTPEAQQWEGWGTALKPVFEPIVVARKPLIGTVAENVLTYGTGGLNIAVTRVNDRWPSNVAMSDDMAHNLEESVYFFVPKATKRDRSEGLEGENFHPTVKPTDLMRYLVKLVTPPNGTVLDPFTGSGSTGKAAILEGFEFIGIEMTEDYIPIIEGRLRHAETQVKENEGLF